MKWLTPGLQKELRVLNYLLEQCEDVAELNVVILLASAPLFSEEWKP